MSDRPMEMEVARAALEVRAVSHQFRTTTGIVDALKDVDLKVGPAKFVSLVGPSGCGKSTFLMILAGLLEPSTGQRLVDGDPTRGVQPSKVAVAFQDPCLLPWRTCLQNVSMPLEIKGIHKRERLALAHSMLTRVGLGGLENRYPRQLSGGMRQRVSVARALVQRPKVLLMDEPFGALDEQTRMDMGEELLHLWDEIRNTVVFVTHNLSEAVYLSDEVVVLAANPGRIVDHVRIDLPRPRSIEITESQEFVHLRNHLWRLIRSGQ